MTNKNFHYIRDLSQAQLWDQFISCPFYKWGTVCFFKYLNLNTLNCMIIYPGANARDVLNAIDTFIKNENVERILIRTDGGLEKGNYIKGGNTHNIEGVEKIINAILLMNRAVIIMTPTNRFINSISINIGLERDGYFMLEVLGPGFDLADLNRGEIQPEIFVKVSNVNWYQYEDLHPLFIHVENNSQQLNSMINKRLATIGKDILPAIGIKCEKPYSKNVKSWLFKNEYTHLFTKIRPKVNSQFIRNWFEQAFLISKYYSKKFCWDRLVIGVSDLGINQGYTFWDIVNPLKKFDVGVLT